MFRQVQLVPFDDMVGYGEANLPNIDSQLSLKSDVMDRDISPVLRQASKLRLLPQK